MTRERLTIKWTAAKEPEGCDYYLRKDPGDYNFHDKNEQHKEQIR